MPPLSIAVIGGGPAGMSFCHAIESMLQEAQAQGRDSLNEISVTCFERSARPGGVWKAADPTSKTEAMNMYEELWTNGPSQNIEFPDYTFDEHFGRPVTVYLPRQEVLGYIIGRVTKNCPDFFEKYIQFEKEVSNVKYDEENSRFDVTVNTVNAKDETNVHHFDKVIWACGDNGKAYTPQSLKTLFRDFKGRVIHSSETGNLEGDLRGKRVLMVGGGYSAEDLALQACKLGVDKVYISTRESDSYATSTSAWPENKVEILREQAPFAIGDCGRVIKFAASQWSWDEEYQSRTDVSTELCDIDTVILCTGYKRNYDMFSEGLYPAGNPEGFELEVPDDWKMPENCMTKHVHEVKPGGVCYNEDLTQPELFQGVLVANPNVMFVWTYDSSDPLLAVDTSAWLLASYCTGNSELPSRDEMNKRNREQALHELTRPFFRYYMDENYHKAMNNVPGFSDEQFPEEWTEFEHDSDVYRMQLLARHMRAGKYPMDIGCYDKLNETAETMMKLDILSGQHRHEVTPEVIQKHPWKTFRDYENASEFHSLHTGTKAVPLCQHWVDIKEHLAVNADEEKKNNC